MRQCPAQAIARARTQRMGRGCGGTLCQEPQRPLAADPTRRDTNPSRHHGRRVREVRGPQYGGLAVVLLGLGEQSSRPFESAQAGALVTGERVALCLSLCGQPANGRWRGTPLGLLGQCDGLLRCSAVHRDECLANQSILREAVIAACLGQLHRLGRPSQGRDLVAGLLLHPAGVLGEVCRGDQQASPCCARGRGGEPRDRGRLCV